MKLNPLCERNVLRGYCPDRLAMSRNGDPFLFFKRLLWNQVGSYIHIKYPKIKTINTHVIKEVIDSNVLCINSD